jgi:hypothetical protein
VKRALPIGLLLVTALGCSAGYAVGHADVKAKPTLQLVRPAPLQVRGRGFEPGELVRLKLNDQRATRAKASAGGSFVASFGLSVSRCDAIRIVASGSSGSRAVLKVLPAPACNPARTS